jgi:DNA modification methylase
MFSVELPWDCVKMHSDRGGVVLEPLSPGRHAAHRCEQTERRCYAKELVAVYCDLIVKRCFSIQPGYRDKMNGQRGRCLTVFS